MNSDVTAMLFSVIGGLGIFLLGMKNMSEGMQAVGGNRIQRLINAVTNNRLMACGVGIGVTCMIQSSTITTVMAVGMVNAGLMNLNQAIGVILGANIGTTITGWILVLKIGKYGLPIIGFAALCFLFSRNERLRYMAMLVLGIGMIFFGLELMKDGFAPLRHMEGFQVWFSRFTADSYLGVIKCCLVGAVLTAIVQSSSATLGITMGLASTGVIGFETAAALVLGENIGTTITAYLASIGSSTNAKRASRAHIIFNLTGAIYITAIFPYYLDFIRFLVGADPNLVVMSGGEETYPHILAGIALTHSAFNVINVGIFLFLVPTLARVLTHIVPDKDKKEQYHLKFLDVRMLDTPAIGIEQSRREILRMAQSVETMMDCLKNAFSDNPDLEQEKQIFLLEDELDIQQKEVVQFLGDLLSGTVPHEVMFRGRIQLRIVDEYESIGDYIKTILKLKLKARDGGLSIPAEEMEDIRNLHSLVAHFIRFINSSVTQRNGMQLHEAESEGKEITRVMKACRTNHLGKVEAGTTPPLLSLIYTDMLNGYRRIKDHGLNIAEALAGEK